MTDDRTLQDAFAEYEQRADAYGAAHPAGLIEPARPRRATAVPMALVAASVVLVLVLAGAVVWLAGGSGHSGGTGGSGDPAAGVRRHPSRTAPPSHPRSVAPSRSGPPQPVLSTTPSAPPSPSRPGASTSTTPAPPPPSGGSSVPKNAEQMERALRRVLGDEATFTVTDHEGNYLIGTLTAASGARGGFDIQAAQGAPGDKATCEDPGKGSHCTVSSPASGGSLAVESETYPKSEGAEVLYYANYVFPDGATFLMHLANRADPKGGGATYGPTPPLTLQQVAAIVESGRWAQP